MTDLTWDTIPYIPMRYIMGFLSTKDALSAMSTCRHWRNNIQHYEARKRDPLKLRTKHNEQNLFLTRIFKKNTTRLHVYVDCSGAELERFMNSVLPEFFDGVKLQELLFIGPNFMQRNQHVPLIKLKKVLTESLLFKHSQCVQRLGLIGCEMDIMRNANEEYASQTIEIHSRPLRFCYLTPTNLLSSYNRQMMQFSTLNHVIVDYDHVTPDSIKALCYLGNLRYLSMNITNKKHQYGAMDWEGMMLLYDHPLEVSINIIAVSLRRFEYIMNFVLVEGLPLVSLKVMFCRSLFTPLLSYVSRLYQATLREVVWVDSPYDSRDQTHRIVRPLRRPQPSTHAHMNPFVLLCWQCVNLRRLVIHGYWVWQYDLLGFVRLRRNLTHLEVSAIYDKQDKFNDALRLSQEGSVRVLCNDRIAEVDPDYINEVNEYTEFEWEPMSRNNLHPALRGRSTQQQQADYVLQEARHTYGLTN